MKKVWLLARITYLRRLRSGMFLVLTLGLPLLMLIAGAVPILLLLGTAPPAVVGYVDQTGRLAPVTQVAVADNKLKLIAYNEPAAALTALEQGQIGGYLVIPRGYFQGQAATFYAARKPGDRLEEELSRFMRQAMLPNQPGWLLDRLADPAHVVYTARESGSQVSEGLGLTIRLILPFVLALMFALIVFTGANQMGSVIVQEKEQRALEMVITSLRPIELVAGKVTGMTLLSLTQIAIWLGTGLIAATLALAGSGQIGTLSIPWAAPLWALLLGVPAYFLYAALASGLGIIAGDSRQAQQLAGVLGLVGLSPLWFAGAVLTAPAGPLAVFFTLFPLTAPIISLMRMAVTEVPTWQLTTSLLLLLLSLAGAIWLVARLFRAAMLMYGQTLRPQQILAALWEAD
jgi:ABC-2 type transport system permease protein